MASKEERQPGKPLKITKWMHLWNSANLLSASSPQISQHLGHKLVLEGAEVMSSFSKGLLCEHCGTLAYPSSSTRIRRRKRALRGRQNKLIRNCDGCGSKTAQDGSFVRQKERKAHSERIMKRKRSSAKKQMDDNGIEITSRKISGGRVLKSNKCSSKKGKAKQTLSQKQGTRRNGLTSSFLFDDIDG